MTPTSGQPLPAEALVSADESPNVLDPAAQDGQGPDEPANTLWRHPDFMKLWAGQTVSELCSRITRDGLPLAAVLVLGATPAQMGVLAASGAVPVLLMGLVAGAGVDRLRRRPLMIAADLARALILLLIPLGAVFGFLSIGLLYAAVILTSIFTVFFDSAYQAYLPSLVTRAHLVEGNSKLALSGSLAEVLGPGLAGFLVQALTAPVAILVDSLSFVVSAVSLTTIRHSEAPPAVQHERRPIGHEMIEGMRTIWHDPTLRSLALSGGTRSFFGNFIGVLYAIYAIRVLGFGAAALGLTIAMGGVGDLFGALLAPLAVRRFGLRRTLISTTLLSGLISLLVPLARGPLVLAIAMLMASQLLSDGLRSIFAINEISLRQTITPDRLLGRVTAGMQLMTGGVGPLGALVGGALGGAIGLRPTLVVAALGGGLLGAWWLLRLPATVNHAHVSNANP